MCRREEYDAAFRDLDQAIKLKPDCAAAYRDRGRTWFRKEAFEKSISDLDRAIELDPSDVDAFVYRGDSLAGIKAYIRAGDDLDRAIVLNPEHAPAHFSLGLVFLSMKEYENSQFEFEQTARIDPNDASGHFEAGVISLILARAEAVGSARKAFDLQPREDSGKLYSLLIGHFGARRAGQKDEAKRVLDEDAQKCDPSAWPYPIVKFLRGELDEQALLALAVDDDKKTEAHCYLGLHHVLIGHIEPAREHFQWVKEHGKTNFTEYDIAIAELDRLAKDEPEKTK